MGPREGRAGAGDEPTYGNQDTDGSRSLRHFFDPMRRAGAAARQMLREAAAAEWGVPVEEVTAENHILRHEASGREAGYGDMATRAAEGPVPAREGLVLKSPDQFRYIGRDDIGLIDNPDIVTGATTYGMDAKAEGMLFAVIARPRRGRPRRQPRRHRGAEGAGRAAGRGDRRPAPAVRVPAPGRRRGDRHQYLGRHARTRGLEHRMGGRPPRRL
ncbi:hypothetical protein ACFSYD_21890 [Paracoccus aerius]